MTLLCHTAEPMLLTAVAIGAQNIAFVELSGDVLERKTPPGIAARASSPVPIPMPLKFPVLLGGNSVV